MIKKATFALLLLFALPANAADTVLNAGSLQVLTLPDSDDVGLYGYVGASIADPVNDDLMLIYGLSVEYAPDAGGEARWGFVGTFISSFAVGPASSVDGILTILHDQSGGDFGDALYFGGVGLGYTHLLGKFSISPSVSIYYDLFSDAGASYAPLLNVGYVL